MENKKPVFNKERLISELRNIHGELVEVYLHIFREKYSSSADFFGFVNHEYAENGLGKAEQEQWNIRFCHRVSYTLINKILFIRICEDNGFMAGTEDKLEDGGLKNPYAGQKLSKAGYLSWMELVTHYTLGELLKLAFSDMGKSYPSIVLYREDSKYEQLNPLKEELEQKFYLSSEEYAKTPVSKFEAVIADILEKLDTERYDFAEAVRFNILGDVYEKFLDREARKALGQFYTPNFVIEYILENTVAKEDIVENPFVSVLDPACGSGHFLIMAYDILKKKFEDNLEALREKYAEQEYELIHSGRPVRLTGRDYWQSNNLHYHILKHCIYGSDIDDFAVQLTTISLLLKDLEHATDELNIIQCDSLIKWEKICNWQGLREQLEEIHFTYRVEFVGDNNIINEEFLNREKSEELLKICQLWAKKYDYVVGNPPYVGHKQLTMEYKKWLLANYEEVFRDKSDLSYCFFHRALELLNEAGRVSIITSRYFMESPTGRSLRKYLLDKAELSEIIDFYGAEIFKGVGVATAIYTFGRKCNEENTINICKLKQDDFSFDEVTEMNTYLDTDAFEKFDLKQEILEEDRWILIPEWKYSIYKKIENSCEDYLSDLVISYQGIITGCDKAFVLTDKQIAEYGIERELLRPWIKNSNVSRYGIKESKLWLIYSDLIKDEADYPNSIAHIGKYRKRLETRRECKSGARKWYELQWGRELELFEQGKIVYPYKAQSSRFAIDTKGLLCSADVYSFCLNMATAGECSVEYLAGVLNSKIYEFYFKLFAKKMGTGVYDYYPNSVLCLKIPDIKNCRAIEEYSRQIIAVYSDKDDSSYSSIFEGEDILEGYYRLKNKESQKISRIYSLENKINRELQDKFGLTDSELEQIDRELGMVSLETLKAESLYSLEDFYKYTGDWLAGAAIDILEKEKVFLTLEKLEQELSMRLSGFDRVAEICINAGFCSSAEELLKKTLPMHAEGWSSYMKGRETEKECKLLLRYDDNTYGLTAWTDEVHKEYFQSSLEEYTNTKPNIKKAENVIKILRELNSNR